MKCSKCGHDNKDNNIFCEMCGNELTKAVKNNKVKHKGKRKTRKIILLIIGILLIAAIGILIYIKPCFNHHWEDATCTEPVRCSKCGREEGKPLGHIKHLDIEEPTCTKEGYRAIRCERCHVTIEKKDLQKKKHHYTEWVINKRATCEKKGSKVKTCIYCGKEIKKAIKKKGHKYSKWKIEKDATCEEDGKYVKTCKRCKKKKYKKISSTGHSCTEWIVKKQATCAAEGLYECTCSKCNKTFVEPIPKTAHNYSEWTRTIQPQLGVEGRDSRTCSVCGAREDRAVPALTQEDLDRQLEDQLNAILNKYIAIKTMENYGKTQYPAGFKMHTLIGVIAEKPENGNTWFLKYEVTIKNLLGVKYDTVVEASVTGTTENPRLTYFYVY